MPFLPTTPEELTGDQPVDFVLITGDAYIDHPSFGASIIARTLERYGYSVAIIAQPDWRSTTDFTRFGQPRLAFLVTGGNIDSMVNAYSVALNKRKTDVYSPGGEAGKRPNRATIVYCNKLREVYKNAPIIIGGIEASLRRLAHYDYWDNKVRRSILLDSAADLIVYGMGEKSIIQIAEALDGGLPIDAITYIDGTVFKTKDISYVIDPVILPPFDAISQPNKQGKETYARSTILQYDNTDYLTAKPLIEPYSNVYVVQNVPAPRLTTEEFDTVYDLPYERHYHPMYEAQGGVPAIEEVKFSLMSNRGCFGNCNFCAITFHQGRIVQARSHESLVKEAKELTQDPDFKGYIHDVGGPTANFRFASCDRWDKESTWHCKRQCLTPTPCPRLKIDHTDYLTLLKKLREIPRIKKVFVRSGIRYDYVMHDPNHHDFLKEISKHHISGRLKVAPEHVGDRTLSYMGKPSGEGYKNFCDAFTQVNDKLGTKQYIVPYLMSSHPGATLEDGIELAEWLQQSGHHMPEQVQDFYPTPGTLSTCMYYTGLDPRTMEPVYVEKSPKGKQMQRALMQYRLPVHYKIVKEALEKAKRKDLIGHDPKALIRPKKNRP